MVESTGKIDVMGAVSPLLFRAMRSVVRAGGDMVNRFSGHTGPKTLPPIRDNVLLLPTHILAEKIRRRELSSENVVRVFINRCRVVQPFLNAIVDDRYDDAIEDAKAIDKFLKETTLTPEQLAVQKPFLGLPFTVKDSVQVTGMKWTSGCLRRKDIYSFEDAPVVRHYRKAGAIPIALTNVPELLLWFASSNKVYGATNNPFDGSRTPGGSSGGEAALVTSGGSPLSISSDIAGSIRMPAFHCGLFGHKPTPKVVPWTGTFPEIDGGLEELFAFGPLCRFASDLAPALKVMAGDNVHLLGNLDEPVDMRKLRVFYLDECEDDMSTQVEPYIRDSIVRAAQHLGKKYGCPVDKAKLKHFKDVALWYTILFANQQEVSKLITDNTHKINPFYELCKGLVGCSEYSMPALTVAAAQSAAQSYCSPTRQPSRYIQIEETLKKAKGEFYSLLGDDGVFIYVTLPRTALSHYATVFEFTNVCCPMVMNYLRVPATEVPTGTHEGLPYGIQIAASPYKDRLTLAVAKELEELFGGWISPSDVDLTT